MEQNGKSEFDSLGDLTERRVRRTFKYLELGWGFGLVLEWIVIRLKLVLKIANDILVGLLGLIKDN